MSHAVNASKLRSILHTTGRFGMGLSKFMAFIWMFTECIGGPVLSEGASMYPTLPVGTTLYIQDRFTHKLKAFPLRRGDLVTAHKPTEETLIAKRLIGLPGDVVCYDPTDLRGRHRYIVVPKGHVWLAGDNTSNSTDSRHYGPVPIALVRGRLVMQLSGGFKLLRNSTTSVSEVAQYSRTL